MTDVNNIEIRMTALESAFEGVFKTYWEVLDKMEARLETMETILATTVSGYAEMAGNVQAILNIMANASPEERLALETALKEQRTAIIEALSYKDKGMVKPNKNDGVD